ncbi:MAG: hypothetical protein C0404_06135 [Verrucomicrobia bacterium]|nr:hypothetical protein [Verrucomicrobiota bacterium]
MALRGVNNSGLLPAAIGMGCILLAALPARAAEIHEAVSARDYLRAEKILAAEPAAAKSAAAKGVTPLHHAAALNYADIAELLIRNGADVNARTSGGFTPLHWAAYKDAVAVVRLLLKNGADPALKSGSGVTPHEWAVKNGADKAAAAIEESSAAGRKKPELPPPHIPPATLKMQGKIYSRWLNDVDEAGAGEAGSSLDTLARLEGKLAMREAGALVFASGDMRSKMFDMGRDGFDPEFDLREAYAEVRRKDFAFSLGRQIVTWGKLDEFVILDRVSPQDYDWFVIGDKMDRKQPLTMIRAEYFGRNVQVESLLIPKFDPTVVRFFGTDWAYFGHMKDVISSGDYPQVAKDAVSAITIDNPNPPNEAEFAVRLRARLGDADCGFYYMSLFDRVPGLREQTDKGVLVKNFLFEPSAYTVQQMLVAGLTPADLFIKEDYKRNNIAGVDFETVAGEYGIRGECAYISDQPMTRKDFSFVRKDLISAGMGVDHTAANDAYLNLQVVGDFILDYEPLFAAKQFSHQFILNVSREFLLGDLQLAMKTAYQATYRDWMINPAVSYKMGRGVELEGGAYLFSGDPWTLFGRFDTKDSVYLEARYRF